MPLNKVGFDLFIIGSLYSSCFKWSLFSHFMYGITREPLNKSIKILWGFKLLYSGVLEIIFLRFSRAKVSNR